LYMAPEACAGDAALPADVWSYGVTLHQMLARSLPFPAEALSQGPVAFMYALGRKGGLEPIVKEELVNSPAAISLLLRCLVRDPESRPSARAILDDEFFYTVTSQPPAWMTPTCSLGKEVTESGEVTEFHLEK